LEENKIKFTGSNFLCENKKEKKKRKLVLFWLTTTTTTTTTTRFCRRRRRRRGVLLDAMPLADDDVDLDGDDQRICRCCCVLLYAMPLAPPLLAIINQSFVYLLSCFLVLVLFVCLFVFRGGCCGHYERQ
jgi:hypothetical protein